MFSIDTIQFYNLLGEYTGARDEFSKKIELINTNIPRFMSEVDRFLELNPEIKNLLSEDKIEESSSDDLSQKVENENTIEILEDNVSQQNENSDSTNIIPLGNVKEITVEESTIERDRKLKDLYRKIVKITHPDKTLDQILHELYIKATSYYNEKDLLSLFYICYKLSISFNVDSFEIEEINHKISDFKNKNKFLDSNLTLIWLYSDKKERVILDYILSQIESKRMRDLFR